MGRESGLGNPLVTLFTFWNKVHLSYFPSKSFNYDLADIRTLPLATPTRTSYQELALNSLRKVREPSLSPDRWLFSFFPRLSRPFCLGRRFQE